MRAILTIHILILLFVVGCAEREKSTKSFATIYFPSRLAETDDSAAIERAIRAGELGEAFAERAANRDIHVREITNAGIPYKVFSFHDYKGGYIIMVENSHLILLANDLGCGYAEEFNIEKIQNKEVLTYKYDIGSELSWTVSGRYVLGSGKATWQIEDGDEIHTGCFDETGRWIKCTDE